ncbi:MAG: polyphosphate kinase 1 [Gemmatimonadales bacterium]|nr:polyphosphate kinase 1 [Gemmatimonadales bacterium]NIN12988.1 polyphosphate kinase 1 [Gemmatimonadales bacterium]NIN51065.1 polyphosphate kinase 1 [Gemmatimonadales bacterium]NIP08529.1 polyphosphate kinase 1 [Gemmatimonadales bacterium]NIR02247.1 polyphosphate kinase 1 [Gemmatimonadales bacterium]
MGKRPKPTYPSDHYINRELSWLEFNGRVLEEANDPTNPLLERLKFLAIVSSNLDEFFEVRVAGLQQQLNAGVEPQDYGADGLSPAEQLTAIDRQTHQMVAAQYRLLGETLLPELAAAGIEQVRYDDLTFAERREVESLFMASIHPVLTPLAIDPVHPFPHVHSKSLNIALQVEDESEEGERRFAVVQVPSVLDRVVVVSRSDNRLRYVLLEDIISRHLHELFGGFEVLSHAVFRVTRNADLAIQEEQAEDLLETIEESLRQRLRNDPVRLEIEAGAPRAFVEMLKEAHELAPSDVYKVRGPVDLTALWSLHRVDGFPQLKDEPLVPRVPPPFGQDRDIFDVVRQQDVLVHHPYESFGPVVEFIERAADDPDVLAIKQTLYRTSGPSAIISALGRAAQNGKQVTALVELRARFDEQNNIVWARSLEEAGVHVVYGVVGLKTHCKASLIVRRETDGIRRYLHLSTGNYNEVTARIYTDFGLFTADPEFGEDASALFNLLTGYSRGYQWQRMVVAPEDLLQRVVALIRREQQHAEQGRWGRIVVKMNALVEPSVIDALYHASQAGVEIDLIIRGTCCLRPGMPGVSERIRVMSIVDKFLEHTRVFCFENAGDPEVFLASADWMPRNFFRRVEVMFPVEDLRLRSQIFEILKIILADSVKARILQADGTYVRRGSGAGEDAVRSQTVLQDLAREVAREGRVSGEMHVPYDAVTPESRPGNKRTRTPA